jgi:hypothetical protein
MIDTKQLFQCIRQPELALQNLSELMTQLEGEDESVQNYTCEALENCGPPRQEDIGLLCDQLNSGNTMQVYWASTLLGRFGTGTLKSEKIDAIQRSLCKVISNDCVELSARERAAWAIGNLGGVEGASRELLQRMAHDAPPRLKRLLETASNAGAVHERVNEQEMVHHQK